MDVLELFPEQESFMDSRPGRCRTCAVVGNSNNLLGSHYGAEIDFHDVVMRFNRARIVGYEEDVGNKTTLQLMYPASSMDLDNNTHLMFVPFKTHDLQWLVSAFTPHSIKQTYTGVNIATKANQYLVKVLHPGFIKYVYESWLEKHGGYPSTGFLGVVLAIHICDEVKVLHPGFIKYVHESWLEKHGGYPSTGFLGVVLAIHICDEVNVFGFGADKDGNWRHYWENPEKEFMELDRMVEGKRINLFCNLQKGEKSTSIKGCE
ncbi:hypothetical protein NHX12_015008 [Muraenolepis orangiensis]|uniref:CMP-N-acetylneuraminate-beta-galactosamide-alpha-2,3-sialyltransferase 1 n=1 Tax=Muraenolepis orangiensis TaxID=630683 RepID=A0A9Q0D9M5_9TELE|nr:hypothetical protein NHX12_015008 [Muraenolepis orangiensis]